MKKTDRYKFMFFIRTVAIIILLLGLSLTGSPVHACEHEAQANSSSPSYNHASSLKHAVMLKATGHQQGHCCVGMKSCSCCNAGIAFLDTPFAAPMLNIMSHRSSIAENTLHIPQLPQSQDRPPKYFS